MGVLDGIRILELARVAPAELPAMMLADMGAEVLKIETPEPGRDTSDEWVRRTIHTFVNRNKRSMTLNMKSPEGQKVFRKLASTADVIVEGFRPGVMKRLGADYETLRSLNPRLIYCSLCGFGQYGPYRDRPAHDMNYLSLAGVLNLICEKDRKPVIRLHLRADYAGASLHGARRAAARASWAAPIRTTRSTRPGTTSSSRSAAPSRGSGRTSATRSDAPTSSASPGPLISSCAPPTPRKRPPGKRSRR